MNINQAGAGGRIPKCGKGFSLVEILVVLAIVAILAALIFPAYQKMRRSGDAAQCVSNLRQLYVYFSAYVQEEDGKIPPAWNDTGRPSVGVPNGTGWLDHQWNLLTSKDKSQQEVFGCPAQRRSASLAANRRTYSMNSILANDYWNGPGNAAGNTLSGAPGFRTFAFFQYPSKSLIFSDGKRDATSYNIGVNGSNRLPELIHSGSANLVFLDGHIEQRTDTEIPRAPSPLGNNSTLGSPESIFWLGR